MATKTTEITCDTKLNLLLQFADLGQIKELIGQLQEHNAENELFQRLCSDEANELLERIEQREQQNAIEKATAKVEAMACIEKATAKLLGISQTISNGFTSRASELYAETEQDLKRLGNAIDKLNIGK